MRRTRIMLLLVVGITPFYLNGYYNPPLARHPWAFWSLEVFTWVSMPLVIYLWGRRRELFTAVDLGFRKEALGRSGDGPVVLSTIATVVLALWLDPHLVQAATRLVPVDRGRVAFLYNEMVPPRGPSTGWYRILAIAYLVVTVGLVEEFYYRGLMRLVFGDGWIGAALFLLISSVVFSGAHWEGGMRELVYVFGWGLVFATLYLGLRNLWPLVIAHSIVDLSWLA